MGKPVEFQWRVQLADDEWHRGLPAPLAATAEPAAPGRRPLTAWFRWLAALILLAVAVIGVHLWRQGQAGLALIESDLAAALALEAWPEARSGAAIEIRQVEFQKGQALVQIQVVDPALPLPYRQTRIFRRSDEGWLPAAPDTGFWGAERTLESEFFIFSYGHRDQAAVLAAAPRLDETVRRLRRSVGLPELAADEKIQVQVAPAAVDWRRWWGPQEPLLVVSPQLLPAPLTLSDAEVLAQAVLLPISHWTADEVQAHVPADRRWRIAGAPRQAVQLWSLWDSGGVLAPWRRSLVRWQYRTASDLPEGFQTFCQINSLFSLIAVDMGVLLVCSQHDSRQGSPGRAASRLSHLSPSIYWTAALPETPDNLPRGTRSGSADRGQTLAMATLFEYVVAGYGRQKLPDLLAALASLDSWDEIASGVFGVPAAEFEAGWHTYLAQEYGVNLAGSGD
jgi:hypothetical protein